MNLHDIHVVEMSLTTNYGNILSCRFNCLSCADSQEQSSLSVDKDTIVTGKELVGDQKFLHVKVEKLSWTIAASWPSMSSEN